MLRKLNLSDRIFLGLGIAAFIAYAYLYGLLSSTVDEWCYKPMSDFKYILLVLALILPFIPAVFRYIIKPFALKFTAQVRASSGFSCLLFAAMACIAVAAMFTAQGTSLKSLFNAQGGSIGGFSAGGAKDIQNFRKNIENNYLPSETDITYEGLFYDYYFNITGEITAGVSESSKKPSLFTPVYSWTPSADPLTGTVENYMTIGLRSELDFSKLKRKKLNLVVALDISGSMSSSFREYYYDEPDEKELASIRSDPDYDSSKLTVASRAIVALINHLAPGDNLGMVLFDDEAYLAKPMRKIASTNLAALRDHIMSLKPEGGTNMEAGYARGRALLAGCENLDAEEYENRIIFLTDAMPNTGRTGHSELLDMARSYSDNRIYTTFIGIGVDFQTELVERLTKVRGANYYSIHSSWEFKKRLDTEFDYMVSPMLFDLRLSFISDAWKIAEVYGSPEASLATGELMRVNTLFPSPSSPEGVKGGVIVLKLENTGRAGNITLSTGFETRAGALETSSVEFAPPAAAAGFDPAKIEIDARKAVLLVRYVTLMKEWLAAARPGNTAKPARPKSEQELNEWEHKSTSLVLPPPCREKIQKFSGHFASEMKIIGDSSLTREVSIMNAILKIK